MVNNNIMADSIIKYYTEYLPRISNVIISIEILERDVIIKDIHLTTPSQIELLLSNKIKTSIILSHTVYHPYNKISTSFLQYDKKTGCYTLRLKCGENDHFQSRSTNHFTNLNQHYKWNAKYLNTLKSNSGFQLNCANCVHPILLSNDIVKINELPSELWSEMMEFWHCHKPQGGHSESGSNANKYSILKPPKNSVNVGIYYFSVNNEECKNLIVDADEIDFEKNINPVKCQCGKVLGELDFKTNLIKLNKWNLQLVKKESEIERFHPYSLAYSLIVDLINSSAARVFKISSADSQLFIWLFNSGLDASVTDLTNLKNSLKIYFSGNFEQISSLHQLSGTRLQNDIESEEIEVPQDVMEDFLHILKTVNQKLPADCKFMGNWKLGLLPFDWEYGFNRQ